MPKFNYVAMDSRGKETKGTLDVANQNEAISRLKEMGYFPTKVTVADKAKDKPDKKTRGAAPDAKGRKKGSFNINIKIPGLSGKVKPKVLTTFTRQLATLVDAGLPLLRGLRVLERQEKNLTLKGVIADLALAIEGGSTFSEGLAQHLEVVLNRLSEFMEKAQKIRGKVKAAMFYPCAVMFVAVTILTILMVFVIPKFELVFKDMLEGQSLPAFTEFVLSVSRAIAGHFVVALISIVSFFILLK